MKYKLMTKVLTMLLVLPMVLLGVSSNVSAAIVEDAGMTGSNSGAVTVTPGAPNITNIDVTTNDAIWHFTDFDIAAIETVNCNQNSAASRAVFKINSADGTQIYGKLNANGQVALIDGLGFFFANGAIVNTNVFVASTNDFSDDNDFFNNDGIMNFDVTGNGKIENLGTIMANEVYLIGSKVVNEGVIQGKDGGAADIVVLAAGDKVYLSNAGSKVMVDPASSMSSVNTVINDGGTINASGGQLLLAAGDVYTTALDNVGEFTAVATSGDIQLAGDVTVENNIQLAGDATSENSIKIEAGKNVELQGDLTAGEDVTITAGIQGVDLTSPHGSTQTIEAVSGTVTVDTPGYITKTEDGTLRLKGGDGTLAIDIVDGIVWLSGGDLEVSLYEGAEYNIEDVSFGESQGYGVIVKRTPRPSSYVPELLDGSIPVDDGCPALIMAAAEELGRDPGMFLSGAMVSNKAIQPCDLCQNLVKSAEILKDIDGSMIAALGGVVGEFAATPAPPSAEQMASINQAFAMNTDDRNYYADAAEWVDALASYVAVLNSDLGWSEEETLAFVVEKYGSPENADEAVTNYISAQVASLAY